jgi:hypothetical protein
MQFLLGSTCGTIVSLGTDDGLVGGAGTVASRHAEGAVRERRRAVLGPVGALRAGDLIGRRGARGTVVTYEHKREMRMMFSR